MFSAKGEKFNKKEKRFYNRETNSAVFCAIQQMSIKHLFTTMQLKWLTLFIIQSSHPIMKNTPRIISIMYIESLL